MSRRIGAIALVCSALLTAAGPSRAQEPPLAPRFIRVASISPFTDATRPLKTTLQLANPTEVALEDITVRLSIYARVFSRSQLRDALVGRTPTALLAATTETLDGGLAPGGQRTVEMERDLATFGIRRTGVYPVHLTLSHSAGELTLHTAVPFVASEPISPLNVAWLIPVTRPVAMRAGGVYDAAALDALALGELTQQVEAIAARPGSQVTLAPSPSLLDTLADLADGFVLTSEAGPQEQSETSPTARAAAAVLDALRRAAGAVGEVASVPYAAIDLPSIRARGARNDMLRQITTGRAAMTSRIGASPTTTLLIPPTHRVDRASAEAVASLGARSFIIDPATLPTQPVTPFSPGLFGPSRPVALATRGPAVTALLIDPNLRAHLDAPDQSVLSAQALIAETASAWLELPALGSQRVLSFTSTTLPPPTTLAALLDGLASSPWVRLTPSGRALADLPPQGAALPLPSFRTADRANLVAARAARASLQTLLQIAAEPLPDAELLEREILLSQSAEWTRGERLAPGLGLARAVVTRADRVVRALQVPSRQVTLTSKTGEVPVTVVNDNAFAVRVRIRIVGTKVVLPGGSTRVLEVAPGAETIGFAIEARAAGSFPIDVRLETPDGKTAIGDGRIILRSTAVSAVTFAATGGGALFLLLAWIRRGARRRKARPDG